MGIMKRLFGKKTHQQNTTETDNDKAESVKITTTLGIQVNTAEKCIQLNVQLINFLSACGHINKEQLATMRYVLNQSGLPASYTQNMLTVTDTVERNLDALSPIQLDEWRVNTVKDLSKDISIYLAFIKNIDPPRASEIRNIVQLNVTQVS